MTVIKYILLMCLISNKIAAQTGNYINTTTLDSIYLHAQSVTQLRIKSIDSIADTYIDLDNIYDYNEILIDSINAEKRNYLYAMYYIERIIDITRIEMSKTDGHKNNYEYYNDLAKKYILSDKGKKTYQQKKAYRMFNELIIKFPNVMDVRIYRLVMVVDENDLSRFLKEVKEIINHGKKINNQWEYVTRQAYNMFNALQYLGGKYNYSVYNDDLEINDRIIGKVGRTIFDKIKNEIQDSIDNKNEDSILVSRFSKNHYLLDDSVMQELVFNDWRMQELYKFLDNCVQEFPDYYYPMLLMFDHFSFMPNETKRLELFTKYAKNNSNAYYFLALLNERVDSNKNVCKEMLQKVRQDGSPLYRKLADVELERIQLID